MNVETLTDPSVLEGLAFEDLVQQVDLVCVTDHDRESLVRLLSSFLGDSTSDIHGRLALMKYAAATENPFMQGVLTAFSVTYSVIF